MSGGLSEEACCDAATEPESSLLLACIPSTVDVNEVFTYDLEGCKRTYDVLSTFTNTNGVSTSLITQTNQLETDISDTACCEQSSDSIEDPLIEACESDDLDQIVVFSFDEDECSSTTTTTTVYFDAAGDEKARREQSQLSSNLDQ